MNLEIIIHVDSVDVILWTDLGYNPLQVVFAHVGGLVADGLLRSLHGAAQVATAALELLQLLHQVAALLLPARRDFRCREDKSSADT